MSHEEERDYRRTDDSATIEFRTSIKEALKSLNEKVDFLREYWGKVEKVFFDEKKEINEKLDNHQDRLARIETSLGSLVKVAWLLLGAAATIIVGALLRMILK